MVEKSIIRHGIGANSMLCVVGTQLFCDGANTLTIVTG